MNFFNRKVMSKRVLELIGSLIAMIVCVSVHAKSTVDLVTDYAWRANKFCLAKTMLELPHLSVGAVAEKAKTVVECLPDGDPSRNGLLHLMEIVGLGNYNPYGIIRGANEGMIEYFQQLILDDEVFEQQLLAFLADVKSTQVFDSSFLGSLSERPLSHRPTLDDEAGKEPFLESKPGWIWEIALDHSKGDSSRALQLIAVCGNDDVLTKPIYLTSGETLTCPFNPGFFVAKSLGEDADISESLKNKILGIQYSDSWPLFAPSKYYHVYSNAFLACEMMSKGMPEQEAADIVKALASLCIAMRIVEAKQEYHRAVSAYKSAETKQDLDGFILELRNQHWDHEPDQDRKRSFVGSDLVRFDAVFLLDRWSLGETIPLVNRRIPIGLKVADEHRSDIPDGWSDDRFNEAVRRLETFEVDSEWTEAQALVGAAFASHAGCLKKKPSE
jgi:hypothetical protein